MKKNLTKIVLATMMAAAPMAASDFTYSTNSLFALEGGYSSLNDTSAGGRYYGKTDDFGSYGLKIGAESKNYRIFAQANYHDIKDFDYAYTYGAALQYKFNFADSANFFIGINGGYADMKIRTLNVSDPYFGGDAGFNYHASELIDLELAARLMKINNDAIDNIVTGYASIIFKYQMD